MRYESEAQLVDKLLEVVNSSMFVCSCAICFADA